MKLFRPILGLLVGAIILLHSLVPHEHYSSVSEVAAVHNHKGSVSLFVGLQISLGLNHGAGHFEQYVAIDQDLDDFILSVTSLAPLPCHVYCYAPPQAIPQPEAGILVLDRLRGPPVVG